MLADFLPGNAGSWALTRVRRLLLAALPDVRGVVAECDPVERCNETGAIVKCGHVGTIYKASNARLSLRQPGLVSPLRGVHP